ncbi:unnamed protein product, partial [Brassica oleracea]
MYHRSRKPADHLKEGVTRETKAGKASAKKVTVFRRMKPGQ